MKYLKKIMSIVFLVLLCCVFGNQIPIQASSLPPSGTEGKCGKNVKWTYVDEQWVYNAGIYISGTGEMYDYDEGKAPWYGYAEDLKEVVVCNGVTSIGKNAFYGMTGLKRLCITDDVIQIDETALDGCSKELVICANSSIVKEFAQKHGYTVIENYAVPASDEVVVEGDTLPSGYLNYTVTMCKNGIGEVAVSGVNLEKRNVIIPSTISVKGRKFKVTAIAENAFKNNKKLVNLIIGKNISSIEKKAFYNCTNLKKIIIRSKKLTQKSVGKKAFTKVGKNNFKKLVIKVPASKQDEYQKILINKGISKKAKIKS